MRSRCSLRAQALALCVFGYLGVVSTAHAGEFPVSGAYDFVRESGKPSPQSVQFSAPVAGNYYQLRIYNGQGASSEVTSGSVVLNGAELFSSADFKKKTTFLETSVSLQLQNALTVILAGKPGSGLRIEVIGIDNDKPTISAAVNPDANPAGWHNVDTKVTFSCSDALSGIESCSNPVLISEEGANQVVDGSAVDRAGNIASTEVAINLDKTAPQLGAEITPPANSAGWHRKSMGSDSIDCSLRSV